MEFTGRSYMEHSRDFYKNIWTWLRSYFKNPRFKTSVVVKIEYAEEDSWHIILGILTTLQNHPNIAEVEVDWFYNVEDEANEEEVRHFASLFKFKSSCSPWDF